MKRVLPLIALLLFVFSASNAQKTPFEKGNGNQTATYAQAIDWYRMLDETYSTAKLLEIGPSDSGKPLHLFVLSADSTFEPDENKLCFLINNGIHPGEPEGIDASMMLARDLLKNNKLVPGITICIIPVYNIGGALNRNSFSRANQNGPESYGFRGNARNLDLNRDFVKSDSKNARTFQKMFSKWKPEVFVDTHTSNGADYQHIITYIATQKDKLHEEVAEYMTQALIPRFNKTLSDIGLQPVPYMHSKGETPTSGIIGFYDSPRYSTGYSTLFNTMGFVLETHMLKPFADRVFASYTFLDELLNIVVDDKAIILENKQKADAELLKQRKFPLNWTLDTTSVGSIPFKGYLAVHKPSEITGKDRLFYDRTQPFEQDIPYYNHYVPQDIVKKPDAYIIPQAWGNVAELMRLSGVKVLRLDANQEIKVGVYTIKNYETLNRPYEGHYLHHNVEVEKETKNIPFREGDYIIFTDQPAVRYIIETLEPQAKDSFFAWNYFDSILGRKEYFSPYVFEDTAVKLLAKNKKLKKEFEKRKAEDADFASNAYAQLGYIYQHSPYAEKEYQRYPVYRVE